jgi:hypothetical protein
MLRVNGNTGHRANLYTLGLVKMPDTLGALGRVDFINLFAQINGLVRALRFAHITVDAFIGDHQCHGWGSAKVCIEVMPGLSATVISPNGCRAVACLIVEDKTPHTPPPQAMHLKWNA